VDAAALNMVAVRSNQSSITREGSNPEYTAGKVFVPQCALAVPVVSEGIDGGQTCECVIELARREAQPFSQEEVTALIGFAHRVRGVLTNFASWAKRAGKDILFQNQQSAAELLLHGVYEQRKIRQIHDMVYTQIPTVLAVPHVELITIFNDQNNALNGVKFDFTKEQFIALPIKGHFADLVFSNKSITLPEESDQSQSTKNFTFSGAE